MNGHHLLLYLVSTAFVSASFLEKALEKLASNAILGKVTAQEPMNRSCLEGDVRTFSKHVKGLAGLYVKDEPLINSLKVGNMGFYQQLLKSPMPIVSHERVVMEGLVPFAQNEILTEYMDLMLVNKPTDWKPEHLLNAIKSRYPEGNILSVLGYFEETLKYNTPLILKSALTSEYDQLLKILLKQRMPNIPRFRTYQNIIERNKEDLFMTSEGRPVFNQDLLLALTFADFEFFSAHYSRILGKSIMPADQVKTVFMLERRPDSLFARLSGNAGQSHLNIWLAALLICGDTRKYLFARPILESADEKWSIADLPIEDRIACLIERSKHFSTPEKAVFDLPLEEMCHLLPGSSFSLFSSLWSFGIISFENLTALMKHLGFSWNNCDSSVVYNLVENGQVEILKQVLPRFHDINMSRLFYSASLAGVETVEFLAGFYGDVYLKCCIKPALKFQNQPLLDYLSNVPIVQEYLQTEEGLVEVFKHDPNGKFLQKMILDQRDCSDITLLGLNHIPEINIDTIKTWLRDPNIKKSLDKETIQLLLENLIMNYAGKRAGKFLSDFPDFDMTDLVNRFIYLSALHGDFSCIRVLILNDLGPFGALGLEWVLEYYQIRNRFDLIHAILSNPRYVEDDSFISKMKFSKERLEKIQSIEMRNNLIDFMLLHPKINPSFHAESLKEIGYDVDIRLIEAVRKTDPREIGAVLAEIQVLDHDLRCRNYYWALLYSMYHEDRALLQTIALHIIAMDKDVDLEKGHYGKMSPILSFYALVANNMDLESEGRAYLLPEHLSEIEAMVLTPVLESVRAHYHD